MFTPEAQSKNCRQETLNSAFFFNIDYRELDAHRIGELGESFDILFFTGILYHLKNPLQVLEDAGQLCRDAIVIETEVLSENAGNQVSVRQGPQGPVKPTTSFSGIMKFMETNELNGDGTNWWVPDTECVKGMLRVAGFSHFSEPVYLLENRLILVASKKPVSILNLSRLV